MASYLRRLESSSTTPGVSGSFVPDAEDARVFPALAEFLGCASWPDGTERETGTLLLFIDQGRVKACLNDRAQGVHAFFTLTTLKTAFTQLEKDLRGEAVEWRAARSGRSGRK